MIFKIIPFYHVLDSLYCTKISCIHYSTLRPTVVEIKEHCRFDLSATLWRGERWKHLSRVRNTDFIKSSLISFELGKSTSTVEFYTTLTTWGCGFVGTLSAVIPPLPLHNRCFAIITIPSSPGGESARLCSQQLLYTIITGKVERGKLSWWAKQRTTHI